VLHGYFVVPIVYGVCVSVLGLGLLCCGSCTRVQGRKNKVEWQNFGNKHRRNAKTRQLKKVCEFVLRLVKCEGVCVCLCVLCCVFLLRVFGLCVLYVREPGGCVCVCFLCSSFEGVCCIIKDVLLFGAVVCSSTVNSWQ